MYKLFIIVILKVIVLIKLFIMKHILKRLKQGLPQGSSHKLLTIIKWFLFGISESYYIRITNKYPSYKTLKPCGITSQDLHPCDVIEWCDCRNCELS